MVSLCVPQSLCSAWMHQMPSWRIGWWTCLKGWYRSTTMSRSTSCYDWPDTERTTWRIKMLSTTLMSWTSPSCTWVIYGTWLQPVCGWYGEGFVGQTACLAFSTNCAFYYLCKFRLLKCWWGTNIKCIKLSPKEWICHRLSPSLKAVLIVFPAILSRDHQ